MCASTIIFQVSGSMSSSYNRKQYVHSFEESYCPRSPSSLSALFLFSPSKGFKSFAILAICYLLGFLFSCLQSLSLLGSPFFSLLPLFFLLLQLRLFSLLFLSLLFFLFFLFLCSFSSNMHHVSNTLAPVTVLVFLRPAGVCMVWKV